MDDTELLEALEECDRDGSDFEAIVSYEEDNDGFGNKGWTAELIAEEINFSTLAYDDKDALMSDLEACGISNISEE